MRDISGKVITVVYGGTSPEREVSLMSGKAVADVLRDEVREVRLLDSGQSGFTNRLISSPPDCVFIALHGRGGEDGVLQGFLETLGIPYTGSGVFSSALCMNKVAVKKILIYHGIPTPEFIEIEGDGGGVGSFPLPVVVKPVDLGSTIGIKIVNSREELDAAVMDCYKVTGQVFLERRLTGREVTVGVIGNEQARLLPVIEIKTESGFYDYNAKYTEGGSRHLVPADLSDVLLRKVESVSLSVYRILNCSGFARMEMIIEDGTPYVIDVNTIPGLTATSLLPDAARAAGITFRELCLLIIGFALEKWEKETERG